MCPWMRRKKSPIRLFGPLYFDELPQDVLILILSQCRIDEIFALRLTCSKFRNLISAFPTSIIPSVARSTFPRSDLLLRPPADATANTLTWLKDLILQHLAGILVDRHRFSSKFERGGSYTVIKEDIFDNTLRHRMANGWRVLHRLASISAEVYALDTNDVSWFTKDSDSWNAVHPSRYDFEMFRQREALVLQRRLQYIDGIGDVLAGDYVLMFILLRSAFRTKGTPDGLPYDWSSNFRGPRWLREKDCWLTWFILHEGPQLFWEQWWSLSPEAPKTKNHIRDRYLEAWSAGDQHEECHDIQRRHGRRVQRAIEDKTYRSEAYVQGTLHVYFEQHNEGPRCNGKRVGEILDQVPFHVDFGNPGQNLKILAI